MIAALALALQESAEDADAAYLSADMLLPETASRSDIISQTPTLYSELAVMLLLVPFTAGLMSGWFGSRFLARIQHTMLQIGVARTGPAGIITIVASTLVATGAGVVLGVLVGLGVRPILDALSSRQIGSHYGLSSYIPLVVLVTLVGLLPGLIRVMQHTPAPACRTRRGFMPPITQLLPIFGLICVLLAIVAAQSSHINTRFLAPVLFGLAVVVFAPHLLRLITTVTPKSLPRLLGMRRIRAEQREASWVVLGVASILMLSFAMLTLNHSMVTTVNATAVSRIPPGQVQLYTNDQAPQLEALRADIVQHAGVEDPVRLSAAQVSSTLGGQIMVVDSTHDLERLYGVKLTDGERLSLESGALISHRPVSGDHDTLVLPDDRTVMIPLVPLTASIVPYHMFGAGAMLHSTATELGVTIVQESWVFVELTAQEEAKLSATPEALVFTPAWLIGFETPEARTEPIGNMVAAFGAGAIASLLVAYYASSTARKLRPTLAALDAVGVPRRWLATVSLTQIGVVVAIALVMAFIGAVIAVYLSTFQAFSATRLFVPWRSILLLGATLLGLSALAWWWAGRRLTASERFE